MNPRQLDLQRRLLVANELRETSLIAELELQWVHRYGVSSLPKQSVKSSPDALPSSMSSEMGPKIQGLSLVSDSTIEADPPALDVAPLPGDSNADDEAEEIEDLADHSSNPPLAVAPPPIALGAQRFRRWMIASSSVQDLQAS